MEIKGVGSNFFVPKDNANPKVKSAENSSKLDKVEISEMAKQMQTEKIEIKNENLIKERIANKFYNSDEVINQVAGAILKEIE
ncbi:MAG TPA: hypothetical protein PK559_04390 [Ignavibacteriaceae bacterium]|nr:hypothetical protein [Ignavibacteriaceae bacterium]